MSRSSRARTAVLISLAALAAIPLAASSVSAGQGRGPLASRAFEHRRAILLIEDRVSFEELMAVPQFRALARAGGAGLMTTKVGSGDPTRASYLTIANGALSNAMARGRPLGLLLNECLQNGHRNPGFRSGPIDLLLPLCALFGSSPSNRLLVWDPGDTLRVDQLERSGTVFRQDPVLTVPSVLGRDAEALASFLREDASPTLVMVVSPLPSLSMDRRGDQVTPLVMAEGRGDQLLQGRGPMHALTSATTRATGVVANVDVAPTILDWFGVPIPSSMDGEPITVTGAPAPFALHRLHLEQRRSRLPVDLGEVAFISAAAIATVVVLLMGRRGRIPMRLGVVMRALMVAATGFPLVIISGGLLPHMTYGWIVPYLVLATIGLAVLAFAARWPSRFGPFRFVGAAGLAFVVIDLLFGGSALRIPLYGNTIFDGARFYGISNFTISPLLASGIFLAFAASRRAGATLLFALGLLTGFPRLGADIGGAVTLFAAAAIWWAITAGRKPNARTVVWGAAVTAVATAAGLAIVLLANRFLPGAPTHATRFVERVGGSAGYGLHTFTRRLSVGLGQFSHVPAAWLPIIGLPIVLAIVLKRPGAIGRTLRRDPRWRDAIVTLILGAGVAYVANDTGVAAAAPAFLYAMAMMSYPVFDDASRGGEPLAQPVRALAPVP